GLQLDRLPRYFVSGQPQHVILRGNNRQVIFATEDDYQFFRDCLVEAAQRFGLAVHAFVWMTNHVYLLAAGGLTGRCSDVPPLAGGPSIPCPSPELHGELILGCRRFLHRIRRRCEAASTFATTASIQMLS